MDLLVHRIQFYDFCPSAFTCISKSDSSLLAAAKVDGSLEVYDEKQNFFMVARIPSSVMKSVESVAWIGSRLFCTGALGRLYEIDIHRSTIKESVLLIGTPVSRCLVSFGSHIIVGNDEGFITVFSIEPNISPLQTLPSLSGMVTRFPFMCSGKVLSIACSAVDDGLLAASTSSGALVVIHLTGSTSHIQHVLMSESEDVVVWSLKFASGVLFSGDNRGTVSVWDITVGGLLHTFPSHIAHVLTLTSSPDENTVFSGGADAIVRRYERCLAEDGQARWELAGTIRGCRRDIRGLVYLSGAHYDPGFEPRNLDSRFEPHRLLAVGLDARLQVLACEQPEHGLDGLARAHFTLAYQVGRTRGGGNQGIAHVAALPFWPTACAPTRPPPACFVVTKRQTVSGETLMPGSARLCLLHYPDKLSLVRLARPKSKPDSKMPSSCAHLDTIVPMAEGLLQLAEVRPRKGMDIISSSLSRCGRFIAYSDMMRTRILKVTVSVSLLRFFFNCSCSCVLNESRCLQCRISCL
ncbi:hypothetical protein P879_08881 [Paragonimus westermani]|uniref:U3 small nucleolar RNA-associated protein 4 n=1 Tax=Paragonimus westermani TaxID=34504 RepID=A0A8T0D437_9TREM|nr:hypothetical protein P879_08881 [Paragonimus westermani]